MKILNSIQPGVLKAGTRLVSVLLLEIVEEVRVSSPTKLNKPNQTIKRVYSQLGKYLHGNISLAILKQVLSKSISKYYEKFHKNKGISNAQ